MKNIQKFIKANPIINENLVSRAEFFIGDKLPNDYKDFVVSCNGGKLYSNSFERLLDGNTQSNGLDFLYATDEDTKYLDGEEYSELKENKILSIGNTLLPGIIGICLNEINYGFIYIFDWDFGLTLQASSFSEFLDQVTFDSPVENWQNDDPAFA